MTGQGAKGVLAFHRGHRRQTLGLACKRQAGHWHLKQPQQPAQLRQIVCIRQTSQKRRAPFGDRGAPGRIARRQE
ncbi:MAG: hypothetical protein C4310_12680, partial [Chloroflexota bacterium]